MPIATVIYDLPLITIPASNCHFFWHYNFTR